MTYTVRQFREKTREAFNKAEAGETVYIERHGVRFALAIVVTAAKETK